MFPIAKQVFCQGIDIILLATLFCIAGGPMLEWSAHSDRRGAVKVCRQRMHVHVYDGQGFLLGRQADGNQDSGQGQ